MNNPIATVSSETLAAIVHFLSHDVNALKKSLAKLEQDLNPTAAPQLHDSHHERVLKAFEISQIACRQFEQEHLHNPEVVRAAQDAFRKETNPWFSQSWIAHRARTKPNGFVGDFEMLIKLYDQKTPATGIGGYLDLCISDLPLARAVRTRLQGARRFLLEEISSRAGTTRILDVASGPCREYHDWPAFDGKSVEVVAMDTDPHALAHVQTNVCSNIPQGTLLTPVRYNALRTSVAESTISKFGRFDIIYSVGLCDYLTDDQLIRLFEAWRNTLTDDGVMYVAFKDCEQYDHTPYQWHLDWFFYQRTHADVLALFGKAGFDTNRFEVSRDSTGIITTYVYRKTNSNTHRRIDGAEVLHPSLATEARSDVPRT